LIAAPLLVLAVVLVLGFAGCRFVPGAYATTLQFLAYVPTDVTVLDPGVTFTWQAPSGNDSDTEAAPASTPSVDSYINAGLTLGPSLMWTLGAIDGLTDRSLNGRDGIALGGVTIGSDTNGPTEFADATATLFDGVDDGIGSAYNPFVGTTARTFVGWARWEPGGPQEYTLFGSSAGDPDRPTLRVVVANGNVRWFPSGGQGQIILRSAAAPAADTWFMWALVADPGNDFATFFIAGARISQQTMTGDWPAAPGTFQAAIGATTKQPFKGAQGLVAVYERGLTDAEIAGLYQSSRGLNMYEHDVNYPEAGMWIGRCTITAQANGQQATADSGDFAFTIAPSTSYALTFQAAGSPATPGDPFRITTSFNQV